MANERRPAGAASGLIAASKTSVAHGQLIRRSSHADESLTCEDAPLTDAAGSVSPRTVRMTAATAESDLTFEDRHSAWLAGVDYGMQQRVDQEIEDQIQARMQRRTLEALGMARRLARAKGPAWEKMIVWSGQADE